MPVGIDVRPAEERWRAKHANCPGRGLEQRRTKDEADDAAPDAEAVPPPTAEPASTTNVSRKSMRRTCKARPERRERRGDPTSICSPPVSSLRTGPPQRRGIIPDGQPKCDSCQSR